MSNEERIISILEKHSAILQALAIEVDRLEARCNALEKGQIEADARIEALERRQAVLEMERALIMGELSENDYKTLYELSLEIRSDIFLMHIT